MSAPTSYFRYEESRISLGCDEWGEPIPGYGGVRLYLREFEVIKVTPTGVRLNDYSNNPQGRLVSRNWSKQWACPTVEEARQSFIARKRRQLRILESKMQQAKDALAQARGGSAPHEVGWMCPKPVWARGTDETAKAAQL